MGRQAFLQETGQRNEPDNPTGLALQRFTAQDAEVIVTWPQSITEARWWAGPHISWPLTNAVVQHWHVDPDVHPYILNQGATLLGYGELWVDPVAQEVELARLIVAPMHRGQGIGVCLVRLLLAQAEQTGYPQIFLRVCPDNHAAITCYLRAGFTPFSPEKQSAFNQGQPLDYLWLRGWPDPAYSLAQKE
jgi:ribosomal protein S18 acetylase RimI-like enzyme